MELLSYPFMQRALLAALLTGLTAPAIGTYIVQRRLALLGDGLGHVAIAGVGLALLMGWAPLPVAVVVAVLGSLFMELLRQRGRATGDVALAILFYGGLAAGVLMAGASGKGGASLNGYLFGSLTTVTPNDLWLVAGLAVLVLVVSLGLAPQLFSVCADEDFAKVQGLPVRLYSLLIVVLAAITVTTAMRTVGLLLVSALLVVPVATAQNVFRSFFAGLAGAMAIGVMVSVGGVFGSFYGDLPPGALIVLAAIGLFALSWPVAQFRHRRHAVAFDDTAPTRSHEASGEHAGHQHGPGCGHRPVEHGDHIDYVHDGHRHAAHAGHYDEH